MSATQWRGWKLSLLVFLSFSLFLTGCGWQFQLPFISEATERITEESGSAMNDTSKEEISTQKSREEAEKEYQEYESVKQEHPELYEKYEAYLAVMKEVNARLQILDSLFIRVDEPVTWTYYLSIKGPTATSFLDTLEGKEFLTGISREVIDRARAASQQLKDLLIEYAAVRDAKYDTDFEKNRAKYAFYTTRYEDLIQSAKAFYENMGAIYTTRGIPGLVDGVGKTPQMRMMIAQSYVLYTALDDSVSRDSAWTLIKKTVDDILDRSLQVEDENQASPVGLEYPKEQVTLPDESFPEPVEKPD